LDGGEGFSRVVTEEVQEVKEVKEVKVGGVKVWVVGGV
jgi:hypothetical protein